MKASARKTEYAGLVLTERRDFPKDITTSSFTLQHCRREGSDELDRSRNRMLKMMCMYTQNFRVRKRRNRQCGRLNHRINFKVFNTLSTIHHQGNDNLICVFLTHKKSVLRK